MNRRLITVACVLLLAAGGTTLAWAATNDTATTIDACVAKNGKVSIYPPGQACADGERQVSWNVQGPAGPQGPQGPPGNADPDAIGGTITINGAQSGNFGSGLSIIAVSHEIVSPRDAASGQATGKRQHKPFVITKEIDKSTPLIMKSLVNNENLTGVLIGLNQPDGKQIATVKLTNAHVASSLQRGPRQTVSFVYQKIEWTWVDGGVTFEDDWETPNS